MSTNIELSFETKVDLAFLTHGISVRLVRLIASVQLKTEEGWTPRYKAIVDTGNPISIVPHFIWNRAYFRWLLSDKTDIYGVGTGSVSGRLAETSVVFMDEKQVSEPLKIKAHLLDNDSIPFLIGFEDILTTVKLVCDYSSSRAYLEWK